MIELDLIEPLDIDVFASVVSAFDVYTASLSDSKHHLSPLQWQAGHNLLFSLIREKPKNN